MPSLPGYEIPFLVADSRYLSYRQLATKYGIGRTQVGEIIREEVGAMTHVTDRREHEWTHNTMNRAESLRWVCEFCPNKCYRRRSDLSYHKRMEHSDWTWKCDRCLRGYGARGELSDIRT